MTRTLVAHLAVVGIWIVCAVLAAGVGFIIRRFLLPTHRIGHGFASVWIGLAGIVLFLQLWNLAAPVDSWALIAVVATGLGGLAIAGVRSGSRDRPAGEVDAGMVQSRVPAWRWFALTVVSLWLANRSLAPFLAYDSGVYMIPGVEWARAFPAVPGLGALHGRLAFNSSNVLLAALLEAGPWAPAAPHLLGGFFLFLLSLRIWSRVPIGSATEPGGVVRGTFDLVLLLPLIVVALDDQLIPSLSADVSVGVAMFASVSLMLERFSGDGPGRNDPIPLIGAVAALVLAVTLKLSAAPFALAGCTVAAVVLFNDSRRGGVSRGVVLRVAAAAALVIGSWMLRGVVLSGYPLYPSTVLGAPVTWRVPAEQAMAERAWASEFARHWDPSTRGDNWLAATGPESGADWVRPWLGSIASGHDLGLVSLPLLLCAVCGFGLMFKRRSMYATGTGWLSVCTVLALLAWLAVAPRPSFGFGVVWVLAALWAGALASWLKPRTAARWVAVLTLLLGACVVANAVRLWYGDEFWTMRAWEWTLVQDADANDWFREPAVPALSEYRTTSGLLVYVTEERSLCWRAPLPCTPSPARNLALRRAGDLSGGFLTDGTWQAERWPNRSSPFLEIWRERQGSQR